MILYRLEYHDPDLGERFEWFQRKSDVVRESKVITPARQHNDFPLTWRRMEIPTTTKVGMCGWLEKNLVNGDL